MRLIPTHLAGSLLPLRTCTAVARRAPRAWGLGGVGGSRCAAPSWQILAAASCFHTTRCVVCTKITCHQLFSRLSRLHQNHHYSTRWLDKCWIGADSQSKQMRSLVVLLLAFGVDVRRVVSFLAVPLFVRTACSPPPWCGVFADFGRCGYVPLQLRVADLQLLGLP
jgi:hypothetical protein